MNNIKCPFCGAERDKLIQRTVMYAEDDARNEFDCTACGAWFDESAGIEVERCESCGEPFTEENPLYNKDELSCLDCYTSMADAVHDQMKGA